MAEEADIPKPVAERRRSLWRWPRRIGILLLSLLGLVIAAALLLDTGPGRRFIADRIAATEFANGLQVRIGRIDGSIYGRATLRDVALYDPERRFLVAPEIVLDWRPLAWLGNRLDIRELVIERAELQAIPELRPGNPDDPLLPGFDIRIDRLQVSDFAIAEGIAGPRRVASLAGSADIRDGRAMLDLKGRVENGGDTLLAKLDAVPAENKLEMQLALDAPADGLVAGLAGLERPFVARLDGSGDWNEWIGNFSAREDEEDYADLDVTVRDGLVGLAGQARLALFLEGLPARLAGDTTTVEAEGRMDDRVIDGRIALASDALSITAKGAVDLADNAARDVRATVRLWQARALGEALALGGARLDATLDGEFDDLMIDYRLTADALRSDAVELTNVTARGEARWLGEGATVPLTLTVGIAEVGNEAVDKLLGPMRGEGVLNWSDGELTARGYRLAGRGINARLAMDFTAATQALRLDTEVVVPAYRVKDLGTARVESASVFTFEPGTAWRLNGSTTINGRNIENATFETLAGADPRARARFEFAEGGPFIIRDASFSAEKIALIGGGRIQTDGVIVVNATGEHERFGPFELGGQGTADDADVKATLESPFPALGLANVELALETVPDGFAIDAEGGSLLGPFEGEARIYARSEENVRILLDRLTVSRTNVSGELEIRDSALAGDLAMNGGGLDGTLAFAPQRGGQSINADINARDAVFAGATPVRINRATIDVDALFVESESDVDATIAAEGISRGDFFLGRVAAKAKLSNGSGEVTASLAGRRGGKFELQGNARIAPQRISVDLDGEFARRKIELRDRAVLTKAGDEWRLAPATLSIGRGTTQLSGRFGGESSQLTAAMRRVPLAIVDIGFAELGLGGTISGNIEYRDGAGGPATAAAKLVLNRFTRAGLVLNSRPVDIAVNAELDADALAARAIIRNGKDELGRAQARFSGMPRLGSLVDRLYGANLFAQLRFDGPADSLWRLIGVDFVDISGPVAVNLDARGSLRSPRIQGSIGSDSARIESPASGTIITNVRTRGRFDGSVLRVTSFTGRAPNGGSITGSGNLSLGGENGWSMDFDGEARNALLVNRDEFAAAVTGPIGLESNGRGGVISGDVSIDSGRFQLGNFTEAEQLPEIAFREVNRAADEAPPQLRGPPWQYRIDATADNRFIVTGLGLDSEWGADIQLRGSLEDPEISGTARLIRGDYEFAGRRFELDRGLITFQRNTPPNPALDIEANANLSGLNATINVRGTGLQPEITFSSVPALPEDELLARLLFGSSITDITPLEAVQLGAALASLRSGGGLGPINAVRDAVGLDRLRLVAADAATGQETAIAAGKYITDRTYVEIITDGRGYSATQVEFQITRWLSILSTISTIGRQSANVRISKDY